MTITKEQITGLVLAGGRGRRMGGADKGLVLLDGRPMIEHVVERLRPQVKSVVINANRNLERYGEFGCEVVSDTRLDYSGPLAGIASGLRKIDTEYVAVVPCDAPLLSDLLIPRLATALTIGRHTTIAAAHDGTRLQQAFLLLKRSMADDIEKYLGGGKRKLETWMARHRVALADFSDCRDGFANVNDPHEHEATLILLRQQRAS